MYIGMIYINSTTEIVGKIRGLRRASIVNVSASRIFGIFYNFATAASAPFRQPAEIKRESIDGMEIACFLGSFAR
jgi:hypothetical protein